MKDGFVPEQAFDLEGAYDEEYKRSKKQYEKQLAEVLAHPLTKEGEIYYPNSLSSLTGPNGYFEPYERNSFYELDNPYPPNERGSIVLEDFIKRSMEDRKTHRIIFLDLMGSGAGVGIADHVFSGNLIHMRSVPNHTHIEGDSVSEDGFSKISSAIREYMQRYKDDMRPAKLHTVFWRPLRAMAYFRKNLYALDRIYTELRELYALQPVGGRIYFQAPSDEWLDLFEKVLISNGVSAILRRHPAGSLMTRIVKNIEVSELPLMDSIEPKKELLAICSKKSV